MREPALPSRRAEQSLSGWDLAATELTDHGSPDLSDPQDAAVGSSGVLMALCLLRTEIPMGMPFLERNAEHVKG